LIYLLAYFILEFLITIKTGIAIGFGWSVVWVIVTSLAGAILLKLSPYAIKDSFEQIGFKKFNIINAQNAAISYVLGAIMLIIPGVFSDILGILLLLFTLYLRFFTKMPREFENNNFNKGEYDVIDVEIIDSDDNSNTNSKRKF